MGLHLSILIKIEANLLKVLRISILSFPESFEGYNSFCLTKIVSVVSEHDKTNFQTKECQRANISFSISVFI